MTTQEINTNPSAESEQIPAIQQISRVQLERGIALATQAIGKTDEAVNLLRQGDVTGFIDAVDEEKEREAREQIVKGYTSEHLVSRIQSMGRMGNVVKVVMESQLPFARIKLQALVVEWERREIERDTIEQQLQHIQEEFVITGIFDQALVAREQNEFENRKNTYYPAKTTAISDIANTSVEETSTVDIIEPPVEHNESELPIPESTLHALATFATSAKFTEEGALAMSTEELLALVGKRADKKTRVRVIGALTEALPKVKGPGKEHEYVFASKHITQVILESGLRKLKERALEAKLLPEEEQLIALIREFVHAEGNTALEDIFDEAQQRLAVIFDPGLVELPVVMPAEKEREEHPLIPTRRTATAEQAEINSNAAVRDAIKAFIRNHEPEDTELSSLTPSILRGLLPFDLSDLPKTYLADALTNERSRRRRAKAATMQQPIPVTQTTEAPTTLPYFDEIFAALEQNQIVEFEGLDEASLEILTRAAKLQGIELETTEVTRDDGITYIQVRIKQLQ